MASEVTQILSAIDSGDPQAAAALLPLVYQELRRLADSRLAQERPGQTLQATALVHEAYLRLVGPDQDGDKNWDSRGHFFAAAAEAMRRILIDRARARGAVKRGGAVHRLTLDPTLLSLDSVPSEVLDLFHRRFWTSTRRSLDLRPRTPKRPRWSNSGSSGV
jgi:RNA polymerase sigma factor (TIGR02999 family)